MPLPSRGSFSLARMPAQRNAACAMRSACASASAALYPAWMLQSSFVWSESLFALLFSLWVLLAWQALRRGGWAAAAIAAGGAKANLLGLQHRSRGEL